MKPKYGDHKDIHTAYSMILDFTNEFETSKTLDKDLVWMRLTQYVDSDVSDIIILQSDEGNPLGFALMLYVKDWFEEYEGHIEIFYIAPSWRGLGVSDVLVNACKADYLMKRKKYNICALKAGAIIEYSRNDLYDKLFIRNGFKDFQRELIYHEV